MRPRLTEVQGSARRDGAGERAAADDGRSSQPGALLPTLADSPISILIVDDEPKNLTVLETVLDLPGYHLVRAESADQALLALVGEEFALLILDVRMPSMTGFELAQVIKGRKKTALVPIIFLTAYYNEDQHVLEGYGTGAVDYLHKPVNAAVLRSKVAVFADLYRKNREIAIANRALVAEVGERRRAEEALQALNDNLDRLVTERTAALAKLEAELRSTDRRKDEFIATLAHELRNPLAPVRNAIHVLQRQTEGTASSQRMRDIIERQVAVMTRLIDDLMDVSRINQGRIELRREVIDLARVIELAVETSRPHIEQAEHRLVVAAPDPAVFVRGDVTRLAQVFVNLLTNAAKYTDRGGAIEIAVERRAAEVLVSVRDNGIGIAAEQLQNVFVMFAQIEGGAARSRGGLGIGLSLVKYLVELHGGRIEARSAGLGAGSAFEVVLPISAADAAAPAREGAPADLERGAESAHALKVLVVDDHRDSAETLAEFLSLLGHEVRIAGSGAAALLEAEQYRPAVVILDIGLPDIEGYEVCRRLRAHAWAHELTVVALSGWGDPTAKLKGKAAGFDGHLVKPVDESALIAALAGAGARSAPS
jgi:signal transduction histidine kinase